jgi:hypothetical protein
VLATTAALLGFSAAATISSAQAQTEALAAATTTTSGSWSCVGAGVGQQRSAAAAFDATGTGAGAYPGPLQATGMVSLHGNYGPLGWGWIQVPFTIASSTTTITGRITQAPLYGFIYCGGTFGFNTSSATYSATIQAPGQASQTISGPAQLSGNLSTQPGAVGSLNATLTLP